MSGGGGRGGQSEVCEWGEGGGDKVKCVSGGREGGTK